MGLAVGLEKMGKQGLLGASARSDKKTYSAVGPLRRGDERRGPARHHAHAGRVRPGGHGVRRAARRRRLRAVRQGRREEPRALDAEPARAVPEAVLPRRGDERGDDVVPEHAAHVLPDRRRRGGRGARLGGEAEDALRRPAQAGGQDQRVGDDERPLDRLRPGPARREHPHPRRRRQGVRDLGRRPGRSRPGGAARLLRHRRAASTTTTSSSASRARPGSSSTSVGRGATAPRPSTCRAGSSRRATRSAPPASPTSTRSRPTCGARPATARSKGRRSGSPTSSASAPPARCTSSRRRRSDPVRADDRPPDHRDRQPGAADAVDAGRRGGLRHRAAASGSCRTSSTRCATTTASGSPRRRSVSRPGSSRSRCGSPDASRDAEAFPLTVRGRTPSWSCSRSRCTPGGRAASRSRGCEVSCPGARHVRLTRPFGGRRPGRRWSSSGFPAVVAQHEHDHLDGLVYLDRMPDLSSLATVRELARRGDDRSRTEGGTSGGGPPAVDGEDRAGRVACSRRSRGRAARRRARAARRRDRAVSCAGTTPRCASPSKTAVVISVRK